MLAAELLLELHARRQRGGVGGGVSERWAPAAGIERAGSDLAHEPRLDFVHHFEQLERHKDHHRLATRDVNLLGGDNVELVELRLQVVAVRLEVADGLGDVDLESFGLGALLLDDLLVGEERHRVRAEGWRGWRGVRGIGPDGGLR